MRLVLRMAISRLSCNDRRGTSAMKQKLNCGPKVKQTIALIMRKIGCAFPNAFVQQGWPDGLGRVRIRARHKK
jgi:hypothetical protein